MLERIDARDLELVEEQLHLLRAETGNAEHVEETGRHLRLQLVERFRAARPRQLLDLLRDAAADAAHALQLTALDQPLELLPQARKESRRVLVGADLERVLAGDLEERCHLLQDRRDLLRPHRIRGRLRLCGHLGRSLGGAPARAGRRRGGSGLRLAALRRTGLRSGRGLPRPLHTGRLLRGDRRGFHRSRLGRSSRTGGGAAPLPGRNRALAGTFPLHLYTDLRLTCRPKAPEPLATTCHQRKSATTVAAPGGSL